MTNQLIVLLGLTDSDSEVAASALGASGAHLAVEASAEPGSYAVSAALETAAADINALIGVPPDTSGPLVIGNRSAAVSRRRFAAQLEEHLAAARRTVKGVVRAEGTSILRLGSQTSVFPSFWLKAFESADRATRPVLFYRGPIAAGFMTRAVQGRGLRHAIFQWHHQTLSLLEAATTSLEVALGPQFSSTSFGLSDNQGQGWMLPAHDKDRADPATSHLISKQTCELDRLLHSWHSLDVEARTQALSRLRKDFDEAVTLTGAARGIAPRQVSGAEVMTKPAQSSPAAPPATRRPLLLHYHIFKNAGTSVDKMLKVNFGSRWLEREFTEKSLPLRHEALRSTLTEHDDLLAFSSHTANLPAPEISGREIIPIIFVRQPLLRIASAYSFERKQDAQTKGAILAKTTDLSGYVQALLDDPKLRHARNFQTLRFALGTPGKPAHERRRALETLQRLPFVGLVEAYDESIERLAGIVRRVLPDFTPVAAHENVTSQAAGISVEERLLVLRDRLGKALYERLQTENADDIELYDQVRSTYKSDV